MRSADYASLSAFMAIAEERSFSRAALRLGLSRSALSHSIRELEERLGARLLNRTTRSVAPTSAGQALLDRIAPAFSEIGNATKAVRESRERPSGTVRLNLPRIAAEIVLLPVFDRIAHALPDVHLEIVVDDGLTDIVASGFDAGIRPGALLHQDMVAVRVTPDWRIAIVGSPEYFAGRKPPVTPADLRHHACVNYRFASGALYRWPFARAGEAVNVAVEGPLTLNDSGLCLAAALSGTGLACSVDALVAPHVSAGRLVRVLEDWCPPMPGFFLYYPSRRQMPPALRAVVDLLKVKSGPA